MRRNMKGLLHKSLAIEARYEFCVVGMCPSATWARDGGISGFSSKTEWHIQKLDYHKRHNSKQ